MCVRDNINLSLAAEESCNDRKHHFYRTNGDVLLPLAHVGAVLQCGASALPEVPATVGVSRLQAEPAGDMRRKRESVVSKVRREMVQ